MSVRFDAATDRISRSDTLPDPADGFTISAWAYLSVDRDAFSTMARLFNGSTTTAALATHPSGETLGYLTGGGSLISGHVLAVGTWSRVAITCTGTSGIVYGAAGAEGATNVVSGTVSGAADPDGITLGGRAPGDAAEWFNGRLSYVRVWSAVLSQAQIEAEWASTEPVITSGLWADYPLLVHTDLTDHSGNGRNLTAGSTAVTALAGESPSTPLTLTDTPTGTRLGATTGQLLTGLVTADTPGGLRTGGPTGALLIGDTLTDQPTGVRAAVPAGVLLLDVIHSDQPQAVRAGGTGETFTAALPHSDLPAASRLGGPAGTLLLGGTTTLTDVPSAAQAAGTMGALLLGSSYTWPPTAGRVWVLPGATGVVTMRPVATGQVSVH